MIKITNLTWRSSLVGFFLILIVGLWLSWPGSAWALIDINTAEEDQLRELPGIGEVIAGRIIEYRDQQGAFSDPTDLKKVSGIGPSTFSDLEELITVTGEAEEDSGRESGKDLIDINTADPDELVTLPGIGKSRAEDIIDYRESRGSFKVIEDIKKVSGIGEGIFTTIESQIEVTDGQTEPASKEEDGGGEERSDGEPRGESVGRSVHRSVAEVQAGARREPIIKISAGRERLASVGSKLPFAVETDEELSDFAIEWSMGDGSIHTGPEIEHSYRYPGRYVVVLNVSSEQGEAVSRSRVEIIEPDLEIVELNSEQVRVKNTSGEEVNLGGWRLKKGDLSATWPQDTVILPGAEITFPGEFLDLPEEVNGHWQLCDPSGGVWAEYRADERGLAKSKSEQVEEWRESLADLRSQAERLKTELESRRAIAQARSNPEAVNETTGSSASSESEEDREVSSVETSFEPEAEVVDPPETVEQDDPAENESAAPVVFRGRSQSQGNNVFINSFDFLRGMILGVDN